MKGHEKMWLFLIVSFVIAYKALSNINYWLKLCRYKSLYRKYLDNADWEVHENKDMLFVTYGYNIKNGINNL